MEAIKLELPLPPSVNGAYTNLHYGNWRVWRAKSPTYRNWEKIADMALRAVNFNMFITDDEWLEVEYEYHMRIYNKNGTKKKRDVANYEKCLSDYLQKIIDWFEDHKIKSIKLHKHHTDGDEKVYITIKEEARMK